MPIKWIFHWQPNAGTTINSQILIDVSNCAESINGVKEGRWKNTFTFYKPILKEQANASKFPQIFLGVSLQEQPNKFYLALSRQRLVVEAESSMQTIMENLQSYIMKLVVNCEGFQYRFGDFRLLVGNVVPINSENLRGIVMEMEYLPISSWETSHLIMSEFFEIWKETLEKRSLSGHFCMLNQIFRVWPL
ncbi:mediator of RNA polymerase II transcription subunit 20a-like [Solanum tuberosum]|uniref:mediator of RNA polymerase II transcription subunit 20a-like n=1 Tax=Solanum tuberosum TaxID=4113 RepID=UPI00073A1908|nr:PREDICTED: mediator of RNA polymerase II transcription subunit 20a-like [Solanum tuberosum]